MQINIVLEHTVYDPEKMPRIDAPQIALAGRSNVGKSSLINSLGRGRLAKVSSHPGKTRSVNFYHLPNMGLYLVDLPGYGYASRSKREREVWPLLVERCLQRNPHLARAVVLLDSRIPPQDLDLQLTEYLSQKGLDILPILTKTDKTKMGQRGRAQKNWQRLLGLPEPPSLFSAKTGLGREVIWGMLQQASPL
jgi:GTP-binding protein